MNVKTRFIIVFLIVNCYCVFLFLSYLFGLYKKHEHKLGCRHDPFNSTCSIIEAEIEWGEFREKHKGKLAAVRKRKIDPHRILILIVVEYGTDLSVYRRAISTVDCYRRIHGYTFMIVSDRDYRKSCSHKDKFFRRHCISAILLLDYDYLLFIDADVGVVNPERRIEEYIDDRFDIFLYDRFHNPEVAAGSYIVKNTPFAITFLNGFADYEWKLMNGTLHGTDNGALHAYLADQIIGESDLGRKFCIDVWHASRNFEDLFAFEACVRALLGRREDFGKIKITKRLVGWMRDSWLTNSLWNPKMDFLLHGWKSHQYKTYDPCNLPIDISVKQPSNNIFPLAGEIQIDLCKPGNTTWAYDTHLIVPEGELRKEYAKMIRRVEENNLALLAHAQKVLKVEYSISAAEMFCISSSNEPDLKENERGKEGEFSEIQTAEEYKRQELLIAEGKTRDFEKEKDVEAANSHILPPRNHPNSEFNSLCKQFPNECPSPDTRSLTAFVTAAKYKVAACLVQKTASTALYGTLCYLRNETAFKSRHRNMLKEFGHLIFCKGHSYPTYENLNEIFGSLEDWKIVFVKRDPLDRFLSGYLDLCLDRGECLQCSYNMTCFMENLYERILNYNESVALVHLDVHLFPQTCRRSPNFTFIRYSSDPTEAFLPDLVSVLRQQNVPKGSIEEVTTAFAANRTVHNTITRPYRRILEARLRSSPYLLELLVKMFYYDFELLGFDFPKK